MTALQKTQTYTFQTLLDTVTGVTANEFTRRNVVFPTAQQMYYELRKFETPDYRDHSPAFHQALNNGLVMRAALTQRQQHMPKTWTPNYRYVLTDRGLRFMRDLRAMVFAPVRVERKPDAMCRALVPAGFWHTLTDADIRHQLEDALHRAELDDWLAQRYSVALF